MAADTNYFKHIYFPSFQNSQPYCASSQRFFTMSFHIFTQNKNTVYVHGLPIHDHGIQRGLSGLIWAPAIADAAITLLHFTTSTAHLHRIQHRAAGLQGAPRYSTTQNTVRHPVYTIYHQTEPG